MIQQVDDFERHARQPKETPNTDENEQSGKGRNYDGHHLRSDIPERLANARSTVDSSIGAVHANATDTFLSDA